jgi:SCF-associated factor 1
MSLLESLPQELYIDAIFPYLPLRDALSLFQVNRFFATLGRDEVFWKRRLKDDFNFNISNARDRGFKFIYSRLNNPRVFVWGYVASSQWLRHMIDDACSESSEGRLGMPIIRNPGSRITNSKQFWPLEVTIPGARKIRIVQLAAG